MTSTNLKRYPRVMLRHANQPASHFTKISNSAILDGNLTPVEFRVWCALRYAIPFEKGYNNRSHLANTLGLDRANLERTINALSQKGYLLVGEAEGIIHWTTTVPAQPSNIDRPKQKKKEQERQIQEVATEELPKERSTPAPVKRNRIDNLPAGAPTPEQLAEAWNKSANAKGDPEYGRPIVQTDVRPDDFTPAVINTLMSHSKRNGDIDPIRLMKSVVYHSSHHKFLNDRGPKYVIGTVTSNDKINKRFDKSSAVYDHKREIRKKEDARVRSIASVIDNELREVLPQCLIGLIRDERWIISFDNGDYESPYNQYRLARQAEERFGPADKPEFKSKVKQWVNEYIKAITGSDTYKQFQREPTVHRPETKYKEKVIIPEGRKPNPIGYELLPRSAVDERPSWKTETIKEPNWFDDMDQQARELLTRQTTKEEPLF